MENIKKGDAAAKRYREMSKLGKRIRREMDTPSKRKPFREQYPGKRYRS